MNKIYKVIWSKVKHCYIVVSELAKNCTKFSKFCSLNSVLENNILLFLCNSAVCSPIFNTNIVVPATVTNLNVFKSVDVKSFKITVAAIVKNEAKNVPQWVVSARSCADEIIVVDTGSTDDTVQRFADYGITCYHYDWNDDFSAAKNYMISLCHGDWIVLLDGDEWFREGCDVRRAIAKHHNNPITKAIIADWICLDISRNNQIMYSGGAVRAFRNQPDIRYFRKVHENLTIDYENFVFEPDFKLYHTGYSGDVNRSKHERNLRIMRTMFDFDNGKVEYPSDWRYVQDTYAGLGDYEKSIWASEQLLSYNIPNFSADSWLTRFNVLFAMKAPLERMDKEFEYCFDTVPSVSGFRFLASIYYFRHGKIHKAFDNYLKGLHLLFGQQDRVALEHSYWRLYLPEASALAAFVYLEHKHIDFALLACKISEQYCGQNFWTNKALNDIYSGLSSSNFLFFPFSTRSSSILKFSKKAALAATLLSSVAISLFGNSCPSFAAGCTIGGSNHYTCVDYAVILGGSNNTASCSYGIVVGGVNGTASGQYSLILGGVCNVASDYRATSIGGCHNVAGIAYWYSTDGSNRIYVRPDNVDISGNQISAGGKTYALTATDGDNATAIGGCYNAAVGCNSLVAGGCCNFAVHCSSSVFGGQKNVSSGFASVVVGGEHNLATYGTSTVVSGSDNLSSGYFSLAAGGCANTASGHGSVAIGGVCGFAYACYSTAIGGGVTGVSSCNSTARYSVAIGKSATTTKNYEVAIGSSTAPVTLAGNLTVTGSQTVTDGTHSKTWSNILTAGSYTLPAATSSALGGVKVGSNITNSSGTISLTKANVTSALGYTPPTSDTNTHYTSHIYVGSGTAANAATTNGNTKIALTDDSTVRNTLTIKGTGKTTVTSDANGIITINSTDTNTTYSNMTAATASAAGAAGLVPAPAAGKQNAFLRGDGTWVVPTDTNTTYSAATSSALGLVKIGSNITNSSGTISLTKANVTAALGYTPPTTDTNTTYSNMGAASASAAGTAGLVPAPAKGAQNYVLHGDGTWKADANTTYSAMSASEATTGTATTARSITAQVLSGFVGEKVTAAKNGTITGLSISGKTITYTKGDGTTGTLITEDNNTTYSAMSADELTAGTATTSRSVTAKVLGDYVKGKTNDKISNLSINGNVITYTKGDGTTGTITTPNTIYSAGAGLSLSGTTLSVNTNGIATDGNTGVVSGGTLYNAVKDAIKYDGDDKSKISLGGTRGTVLSNLLGTTITADSTDAVTGSQLYAVQQSIGGFAQDITKHSESIRTMNNSVSSALSSVAASSLLVDTLDLSKADISLNNLSDSGKDVLRTYARTAVQEYMASQDFSAPVDSISMNMIGNSDRNTLTVTNAGNGSLHVGEGSYVNGTSSIAIGVGNQVNANNSGAFGDPSIINADESYILGNDDTINTGATGSFIVGNDGVSDAKGGLLFGSNTVATVHAENGMALGNNAEVSAKNAIALGSGSIADTENTVSIGNENLKRKITNVADGTIAVDSHEAITGAQLFVTNQKVQENTEAIFNKADVDAGNIDVSDWSSKLGIGHIEDGDTNLVTGGTVYNAVKEIKDNILVQSNGNFITIGKNDVSSKIDVTNSNGEGRVITGVMTDIDDATSVANVGYVTQIGENIIKATNNAFQRVDTKINKAGANAAAIANLPTPTFEGEEKWAFAAGVGHYQGETAGAVGAFYRPNDNVIARVSGSFGNGDEMVGAGVAVSLNKGNTPTVSKAQLVRTINAQAERINVQDSQINAQNERINNMELSHKAEIDAVRAENAELKAMIADLAAKIK